MRKIKLHWLLKTEPHILAASLCINILAFALPLFMLQIYDRVIPRQGYETLTALALGATIAIAAEVILRTARAHLMTLAGDAFERNIHEQVFDRLLHGDLSELEKEAPSVHLDRIANIDRIRDFRNGDNAIAMLDLPFALLFLLVIFLISPVLATVVAVLLLVSILLIRHLQSEATALSKKKNDIDRRRFSYIIELLEGIETIRGFSLEGFMERRYERLLGSSAEVSTDTVARNNFAQAVTGAIGQVTPVVVAATGAIMVVNQSITLGSLAATILLASRIVQPILRLVALRAGEENIEVAESELQELLQVSTFEHGDMKCAKIETIEFKNVTFSPDENKKPLFDDLNFKMSFGDTISLGGTDGSGRSAIMWLMTGYAKPSSGQILINGADISSYDQSELRNRIAYLPQRPQMLEGTILDNLTRFQPGTYLQEALEIATSLGLDEYFASHPNGLHAPVGQGLDAALPTSIADRVPLVGALVGSPDIILFDEANSSLDADGDAYLLSYMKKQKGKASILMVTQRPSYKTIADQKLKIEDGKLVTEIENTARLKQKKVLAKASFSSATTPSSKGAQVPA